MSSSKSPWREDACRLGPALHRGGASEIAAAGDLALLLVAILRRAATAAAAVQDRQLAAETLQHHLGRILLDPALVLPLARLQLALDVHLRALLQILLRHTPEVLVEDHHRVPLGLLLALARALVLPGLGRGNAQVHHRLAVRQPAHLRVPPQIADQYHLVHAASHDGLSTSSLLNGRGIWTPPFSGRLHTPAHGGHHLLFYLCST